MAYLALVRHGESEWNAKNLWTGWVDEPLTQKGREQAKESAEKLRGYKWDLLFESDLIRVKETAQIILQTLSLTIPVTESPALRERNYGIYTGKNKLDVKKQIGEVNYEKLHRGWDFPVEGGESLKQVSERVVPYYEETITPKLTAGQNVIVVASGNSLRALCKYLDNISDVDIEKYEIATGEVIIKTFPTP